MAEHSGFHIGVKLVRLIGIQKDGVDGYVGLHRGRSCDPQEVLAGGYFHMGSDCDGTAITEEMVDDFIDKTVVKTVGEKTTLVHVTLANGFEIVESSSCVDKKNYDETVGERICMARIRSRVWELLGFLLQCAKVPEIRA